jgi:hypothetical protein|tara:strand:+ start:261 stop:536 length:276 start_codon:yes stop_codon:yes gene_type:complete
MKKKNKNTLDYNNLLRDIDKLNDILDELSSINLDSKNRHKKIQRLHKKTESFDKISNEKYSHFEDMVDDKGNIEKDIEINIEDKNNLDSKK